MIQDLFQENVSIDYFSFKLPKTINHSKNVYISAYLSWYFKYYEKLFTKKKQRVLKFNFDDWLNKITREIGTNFNKIFALLSKMTIYVNNKKTEYCT